jgi:hypothetical protein
MSIEIRPRVPHPPARAGFLFVYLSGRCSRPRAVFYRLNGKALGERRTSSTFPQGHLDSGEIPLRDSARWIPFSHGVIPREQFDLTVRHHPENIGGEKGWTGMRLPLLILHILGGSIGLLAGTLAIAVRKGSSLHRVSGNVFAIAMLTLASSGFCLAILKSQTGNIIGSVITFYMICTVWLAGRRRNTCPLDWAALALSGLYGSAR